MKQAATSAALALTGDTTAQVSKRWVKTKALQNQHPADSHEVTVLLQNYGNELCVILPAPFKPPLLPVA
ncbi:hypothetical protein L2E82_42411 [Cichorium intybus]|uniref:Uncharacterized protein n=1 Tax=Cichorium intybus TaxID=13427 RepID=A0ACB8ZMA0_CICIN|nr:hypothetical protein L2E82_42411 [Cichorium intybus]